MDVTITKEERKNEVTFRLAAGGTAAEYVRVIALVCVCMCSQSFPSIDDGPGRALWRLPLLALLRMKVSAPPLRRWPVNRKKVNDKSEQVEWRI